MNADATHQRKNIARILGAAVGVLLLLGLLAILIAAVNALWQLAKAIPHVLSNASAEVLAALIATSGTILVAIFANIAERLFSKNRDIAEAHREHKISIYKSFFDNLVGFLQVAPKASGRDAERMQKQLESFLRTFNRDSILWASPKVIQLYRQMSKMASVEPYKAMIIMDDLMREIRRDLGHSNRGLARGDLWKIFLKDPQVLDEHMKNETQDTPNNSPAGNRQPADSLTKPSV